MGISGVPRADSKVTAPTRAARADQRNRDSIEKFTGIHTGFESI